MSESTREEARKFEIEILETEILELKGRKREEAIKAYRRLLFSLKDEPVYLMRSEYIVESSCYPICMKKHLGE